MTSRKTLAELAAEYVATPGASDNMIPATIIAAEIRRRTADYERRVIASARSRTIVIECSAADIAHIRPLIADLAPGPRRIEYAPGQFGIFVVPKIAAREPGSVVRPQRAADVSRRARAEGRRDDRTEQEIRQALGL